MILEFLTLYGPLTTNVVLAAITALYCFFTQQILRKNAEIVSQMQLQHESFISPVISITIQLRHKTVVCLRIRNEGRSAAQNLRLNLDRDFYQFAEISEDHNLRHSHAFQHLIPSFASGEELFFMLCQGFNLEKSHGGKVVTPNEFTVSAHFEFSGKRIDQSHKIDLRAYLRVSHDRHELLDELEKIRKALENN